MIKLGFALSARMKFIENNKVSIEVLIVDFINIISSNSFYNNLKRNSIENGYEIENQIDLKQVESNIEIEQVNEDSPDETSESNVLKNIDRPQSETPVEKVSHDKANHNYEQNDNTSHSTCKSQTLPSIDLVKSKWNEIILNLDKQNSKLSSFFEETNAKEIKNETLILQLNNGNQFIKKVLESDKSIVINVINDVCGFSIDINVEMTENDKNIEIAEQKDIDTKKDEKDHPLLDDAINMFKGKIIS